MSPEIFNQKIWSNSTDPDFLKRTCQAALERSGFTILGFMEHHFQPQGYTAIWLLGESHLALHTFPENGKSYLEISSCSKDKFIRFLEIHAKSQSQLA